MHPASNANSFRFQHNGSETEDGNVRAYGENVSGAPGGNSMGAAFSDVNAFAC